MPYLQANLIINTEPIFAIAKVPSEIMQEIIDTKLMFSKECEPINLSYDAKKCRLIINGFIFQLTKIKK